MEELEARGVMVVRGDPLAASAIAACHTELLESLARMLSLPQTMAERARPCTHRYMMPVTTTHAFTEDEAPIHRRDFKLPFSPCIEAAVRAALSGGAGAVLLQALGGDATLCELTAITSEPGAAAQEMHADSAWSAAPHPRLITAFLALHDVRDERLGPTRFVPETHAPRNHPGGVWVPPSAANAEERGAAVWFELNAGDAVLMDPLTWHYGGANTSESSRRMLLAVSFDLK